MWIGLRPSLRSSPIGLRPSLRSSPIGSSVEMMPSDFNPEEL